MEDLWREEGGGGGEDGLKGIERAAPWRSLAVAGGVEVVDYRWS
jgi:hypothetical protein